MVFAGAGGVFLWSAAASMLGKSAKKRTLPLLGGLATAAAVFLGSLLLTGGRPAESYMSLHNLAVHYIEKEQYAEAVEALQVSVTLQPDFLPARSNLALALSNIPGRKGEAVEAWKKVLDLAQKKGLPRFERRAERWLASLGVLIPPSGQ